MPRTETRCENIVKYLSTKYWNILFDIGINGSEINLDQIVNKMFMYQGNEQITQNDPIFDKIQGAHSKKERYEYSLGFLKKIITNRLHSNDLYLTNTAKCNFLGVSPEEITYWGQRGGPHHDGNNIDDFLKHHYPFLDPESILPTFDSAPFVFGQAQPSTGTFGSAPGQAQQHSGELFGSQVPTWGQAQPSTGTFGEDFGRQVPIWRQSGRGKKRRGKPRRKTHTQRRKTRTQRRKTRTQRRKTHTQRRKTRIKKIKLNKKSKRKR